MANTYEAWGQSYPAQFISGAEAAGATPFIELEPWHGGPNWDQTPQFSAIISGQYDSWLASIGSNINGLGKPVILTFAHEFNVSGQYPWSRGDTGSCGSSSCTPSQWIQAWNHVESVINSKAGGHAYWMWAPNADTGGSTTDPTPWWPGASEVQMIGVDGYPDTQWGSQFGTFSGLFGPVFSEIHKLTSLPIFISETNLAPLGGSGYESIANFVHDMFASGGDGILEWEDGSQHMTSSQWSQLDTALAQYSATTPASTPTPTHTPTPTPTISTATSPSASTTAVSCPAPATDYGTDTMAVNIPQTGSYTFWLHMLAPSTNSNTIDAQVDTAACFKVGASSSMPTNTLTWINYQSGATTTPMTVSLTSGSHTIKLIGITPGVETGRIILTTDSACVPTGTGDNCLTAPSASATPNPTPTPTPTHTPTTTGTPTPTPTVSSTPSPTPAPTAGISGAIRNGVAYNCLDNSHSGTSNGTKIDLYTCNGSGAQKWSLSTEQPGPIVNSDGKCLAVNATTSGTYAQLWDCIGSSGETWAYNASNHTIVNPTSGLCLDDKWSAQAPGNPIWAYKCNGTLAQVWYLPGTVHYSSGTIKNAIASNCLDNLSSSTSNGNKIDLYTCNGSGAQKWTIATGVKGPIVNSNGKCLAVNANATTSGTYTQLWDCAGSSGEIWTYNATSHTLINPHSGLCLDDRWSSQAPGNPIWVYTCNGTQAQKWNLQ
ncbi:MAG TPA: ricin-type beta-trefoil lectin domain protein [Candidatus Saccharimonadia bacterium]